MLLFKFQPISSGILMAKELFRLQCVAWFIVISIFFTDIQVYSETYDNKYDVTYGCNVTYGDVLETVNEVRSITSCCVLCNGNKQCVSVKYDPDSSICHLNLKHHLPDNKPCPVMVQYASSSGNINDPCSSSDQCTVPNSFCSSTKCKCGLGYSLKRADGSCIKTCDRYGDRFTRYSKYLLQGEDDKLVPNSTTDACMQACVDETEFVCRAFGYNSCTQLCSLSREPRPPVFKDSCYNLYQRKC